MNANEKAAAAIRHAADTAGNVSGNMEEAERLVEQSRITEVIERLEWAKENVRMLPLRIDEALAAARNASAEVSA